jgi:hydrogenase/urease accessory protein HupE
MARKEICALSLISITIMLALPAVSASSDSFSDLKSSISGFDNPLMGTEDLAFYLASHGFDATPKGGFVEVDLGGHVYRLIPNGSAPGLASIAA